ncbi:MAG TPA: exo-beta-N-acetylmuramidase NamZ domain-containing protein, partial [Kutzneria sp.]|nr:exo-beta-N-acetylmuramidase NamZ domain-containing protein [Kutzneria sp.]
MSLSRRGFLAASAVTAAAPAVPVVPAQSEQKRRNGADILAAEGYKRLRDRKVGVLTNPTGVLADLTHLVDDMVANQVRPVAVFGPEHGFRGTAQAGGSEGDYTDPRTGIPVYDAYNVTVDKLAAMYRKAGVDTVVFDIANVGARFYTYTWTMFIAM